MSPGERMSLRRKLKPPKPFTGDVVDDLSSSIQGDRIIDSSEMEETPTKSQPVAGSMRSPEPEPTISNNQRSQTTKKRASPTVRRRISKKPRLVEGVSDSTSETLPITWRPGLGMTPANNKK